MRDGEEEKKVGAATPATVTLAKVTFKLAPFVAEAPPGRPEGGDMSVAYMLSVELARGNSQGIPAESAPCSWYVTTSRCAALQSTSTLFVNHTSASKKTKS